MLSKNDLRELVAIARQRINLNEGTIEKDYYVTQVIHALSNLENETFRVVFCGGTCLAKAHKLVKRMSEDVDFKVQLKSCEDFSKSRLIKELKEFRTQIRSKLVMPGLLVTNDFARNEGKYQQVTLKYPHSFPVGGTLRPDIKIEFTFSNILLSTHDIYIKTLIEDVLSDVNIFIPPDTKCISIEETAVEKWVGLTRRVMAIERGKEDDDKTLIRHVYDLNAIIQAKKIHSNFIELAKTVVIDDGKQFKNQHSEYALNPKAEIRESLALLIDKPIWKERYEEFIEGMVYDTTNVFPYDQAISVLEGMSANILASL